MQNPAQGKIVLWLFSLVFGVLLLFPLKTFAQVPSPNPELNLENRGWEPVDSEKDLINISGSTDRNAPQLGTLTKACNPRITNTYHIKGHNSEWGATAIGLATAPGDVIQVPDSGYQITDGDAQILYADSNSVTLGYFDEDDIVNSDGAGYVVYIQNFNVDPGVVEDYNKANAGGRVDLPVVSSFDKLGTASGSEVIVAIRDSGSFMDPRSRKDWWSTCVQGTPSSPRKLRRVPPRSLPVPQKLQRIGPLRSYPEEGEEVCTKEEFGGDIQTVATYNKSQGGSEPEMAENTGVNFGRSVKGTHCGQTKSEPLALKETVDYIWGKPMCRTVKWSGTLKISDEDKKKFVVPFAKEIADHWAGRSEEHYFPGSSGKTGFFSELEKIVGTAIAVSTGQVGQIAARILNPPRGSAMPPYAGTLKMLESSLYQDQLKCSFINYVKKKGGFSTYAGFSIDGTRFVDIPCPPHVLGNSDTNSNRAWDEKWRKTWAKIGLVPDERSTGELKFEVCEDKEYTLLINYPNVFRLGLAANEVFKLFTAKQKIDDYYLANRDVQNLKQPLDKNSALTEAGHTDISSFALNVEDQPKNVIANVLGVRDQVKDKISDISSKVSSLFKTTILSVQNLLNPSSKPVLAQAERCPNFSVTVNSYNSTTGDYCIFIKHDAPGKIGHVQPNRDLGIHYETVYPQGATLCTWYDGADQFLPRRPGIDPNTIETCLELEEITDSGYDCGQRHLCFTGTGEPVQPGPQACRPTGTCSADCKICKQAQKNPSDVNVWYSNEYKYNKVVLGGRREGEIDDSTLVKYSFQLPPWDGDVNNLPPGCSLTLSGSLSCSIEHERVIDVFNKVPMLASVWNQAASAANGFLNAFKPSDLKGQGLNVNLQGCTDLSNYALDSAGRFGTNPAYTDVTYSFTQGQTRGDIEVELVDPKGGDKKKITFYRLGGVCNADKWFSERVLNPYRGPESVSGGFPTPTGKTLSGKDTRPE